MKNLKPSELPENTVIDDERYGEFIKRADGLWEEMDRGTLGDKDWVTDSGYDPSKEGIRDFLRRSNMADRRKSDDYFKDYKVVASDPEFNFALVDLHGPWVEWGGVYRDGTPAHHCKGYNCEA